MLVTQIEHDLRTAMKARDRRAVAALRMVLSRIKETRVSPGHSGAVTDEEVQTLISREAKRRTEAADAFAAAGRDELAANERAELTVLQRYLPQQLSDDEILAMIDQAVATTGASSAAQFGRVMGTVMSQVGQRADGKRVNALVRERLNG
jgi:uncharacterized protein